jgi:crotonobetainyl-CoA:carnitine CoA-transferase CaiB-like acyl-CoA transferase
MLLAYGVMLALWAREKTGLGQKVETSLLQAAIAMQSVDLVLAEDDPTQEPELANPTYGVYRCADGVYINVAALAANQVARLLTIMDLEYLNQDPRSFDPYLRNEFRREISPVLEELFKTKTSEEWLGLLQAADIPSGPVVERSKVFFESQTVENEMLVPVRHPKAGRTRMLGIPIQLSSTPGKISTAAPLLGEHTEEVLRELGYSRPEIDELKAKDVI